MRRTEFRYDQSHPAYVLIAAQAADRGISFQKRLDEIVREWHMQSGSTIERFPSDQMTPPAQASGLESIAQEWL